MAEQLPAAGYAAGVPRPAVGFSIEVPDHWTVLDLDPHTRERWLDAFLDLRLSGRTNADLERGPARRMLLDYLDQLGQEQVFLAAVLLGEAAGELVSAGATLAWRQLDLGGHAQRLEGLRQTYLRAPAAAGEDPDARRVEIVSLPAGGAVRLAGTETVAVPMTSERRPVTLTQYLVPVLDTDWLAVVTTSTGLPALAGAVAEVADRMAASLRFDPEPAQR